MGSLSHEAPVFRKALNDRSHLNCEAWASDEAGRWRLVNYSLAVHAKLEPLGSRPRRAEIRTAVLCRAPN
jgi:hypothetical protein